jgi:DNA-binding NtrC family response regulator
LLLTSITSLPRDLQALLLPVIEQGRHRVLATDSVDPDQARKQERLRSDLFYSLTTLTVRLETLRDRLEELPLLAQAMLERTNSRASGSRRSGFDPEALAILAQYDWPGNLSQLHRVVEAAHAESKSDPIRPADLPAAIQGHRGAAYLPPPLPEGRSLDETLTTIERRLIELALTRARHNKSRAADLLKISRPRLYRRIKELDLPDVPESTEAADDPSA